MGSQHKMHQWIWTVLIGFCLVGLWYPVIGSVALVCMMAPVITAFFKGRKWCGVFCPRGSFNDILLSRFSLQGKIPDVFLKRWFRLGILVLLMGAFAVQITMAWGNTAAIGAVFVRMIIITTLLTVILGGFFKPRTWCLICPMGTMARYISKLKIARRNIPYVTFQSESCIDCKICSKNCTIYTDVHKYKNEGKMMNADCLKCNVCVAKCPKKALYVA